MLLLEYMFTLVSKHKYASSWKGSNYWKWNFPRPLCLSVDRVVGHLIGRSVVGSDNKNWANSIFRGTKENQVLRHKLLNATFPSLAIY